MGAVVQAAGFSHSFTPGGQLLLKLKFLSFAVELVKSRLNAAQTSLRKEGQHGGGLLERPWDALRDEELGLDEVRLSVCPPLTPTCVFTFSFSQGGQTFSTMQDSSH